MEIKEQKIMSILTKTYPQAHCELVHNSSWQLLVATILSAQCTDKRVNAVTKEMFLKFPRIEDYENLSIEKLKTMIRPTGFFNNKAKYISSAAIQIIKDFDGKVPETMEQLIKIPGIARKSANVILSIWFKKNEGVVVDTHVKRLTVLLGLTKETDVIKIERDLMAIYPKNVWDKISTLLVWHGRNICIARRPKCADCPLKSICPSVKA